FQGYARHQFHDQKIRAINSVKVVDDRDIRMSQTRESQGLLAKATPGRLIRETAGRQYFNGNVAVEALIMSAVDDAHTTIANLLCHSVPPKTQVGHGLHPSNARPLHLALWRNKKPFCVIPGYLQKKYRCFPDPNVRSRRTYGSTECFGNSIDLDRMTFRVYF